jgi:hypothetical protein
MKKSSLFTLLLLLISWTALYAQPGKPTSDTIKCYGFTELQYISSSLVAGRECDTLLSNANNKLKNRDSLIVEKNYEITRDTISLGLKNKVIALRDTTITGLNSDVTKLKRQKKWIGFGWVSSIVAILGGGSYLFIVKN